MGDQVLDIYGVELHGKWETLLHNLLNNHYIWVLILLPFFGIGCKAVFGSRGYTEFNYAELMYALAFWSAQTVAIGIPMNVVYGIYPSFYGSWESYTITNIGMVVLLGWCFRGMYEIGWGKSLWKAFLVFLIGYATVTLFVIVVTLMLAFSGAISI